MLIKLFKYVIDYTTTFIFVQSQFFKLRLQVSYICGIICKFISLSLFHTDPRINKK